MSDFLIKRKGKLNHMKLLRRGIQKITVVQREDSQVQELFTACPSCEASLTREEVRQALYVCPKCGHHYTMPPEKRMKALVDEGSFRIFRQDFRNINPLSFPEYEEKIRALQEKTGHTEAVFSGVGKINGMKAVVAVMNSRFLMGSMGIVVGECITRAIEYADSHALPLIIFTASGGARMQEGMLSLMQMAKTASAIAQFRNNGGLYLVYFTNPTTGGVSASFAGLGDITLAEPGALIGFAGPRVIEQTIGQKLPEGFQSAEYLEEHGFIDQVVSREKMRDTVSQILKLHMGRKSRRIL